MMEKLLLIAFLAREVWFHYATNRLLDKLMSRNYYDYQVSSKAGKIEEPPKPFKLDDEEPEEDLGRI